MNFKTALKTGWGYVDYEVKSGEEHVYQVKTAIPQEIVSIKSTSVLTSIDAYEGLPKSMGLYGFWGDKTLCLPGNKNFSKQFTRLIILNALKMTLTLRN